MWNTTPPPLRAAMQQALLQDLRDSTDYVLQSLFDPNLPICVARAPGRLDVMGGIADYSGSLVLQMPIAEAAFAAVQAGNDRGGIVIATRSYDSAASTRVVEFSETQWGAMRLGDYEFARQQLRSDPETSWAAYVVGPLLVLLRETGTELPTGLRVLIDSRVPEGKGVSSSAAVEVATMSAAADTAGAQLPGEKLARLCQIAENYVVGAPCGIMDQMTAAVGRKNELLALRCQPAIVEGFVPVPPGVAFWGIDSGIRHAVTGSDYASVRCGAFMGYRILAELAELDAKPKCTHSGAVEIEDSRWHGYLANISPREFYEQFESALPTEMSGAEFLARYGGTTDLVTRVEPSRSYAVRQPTGHPIEENARVSRFRELMRGEICEQSLREMGDLMAAAHDSYTACGLGSDGTDLLVDLVRREGKSSGLYGAKITGGGSGGTVAILGIESAAPAVDRVARQYSEQTGRQAHVFRGSSDGVATESP